MPAIIVAALTFLTADLIKKLLIGAGLGLAAATFFKVLIQMYVDRAVQNIGALPGTVLQLLGLFGLDKALSIIIGALIMRAAINAMSISISKA